MDYTIDETKLLNMVENFLNSQKELIDPNICYFKVFPADSDDDEPQPGIIIYVEQGYLSGLDRKLNPMWNNPINRYRIEIKKRLKGFFNIDEDFFWIHFASAEC